MKENERKCVNITPGFEPCIHLHVSICHAQCAMVVDSWSRSHWLRDSRKRVIRTSPCLTMTHIMLSFVVCRIFFVGVAVDSLVCESLVDVMDVYLTGFGYSGHGYMAQWLEQLTADQQVPGSIPAGGHGLRSRRVHTSC